MKSSNLLNSCQTSPVLSQQPVVSPERNLSVIIMKSIKIFESSIIIIILCIVSIPGLCLG